MTKALFFDVFGTLMDWRTSIAREAKAILEPLGHSLDWLKFADAWRGEYQPSMEEVRSGKIPFSKLDVLHRRNLERILPRFAVNNLDEGVLRDLNLAWHRLDAWPDVPPGLARLRKNFLLAPVSNGNIALMANLARRNHLHWDAILGAEVAGDYKPKPRVYLASADAFNLEPRECMMVAAQRRPQGGGAMRAQDRACRAARRIRPRHRREEPNRAGRSCRDEPRGPRGQARRMIVLARLPALPIPIR